LQSDLLELTLPAESPNGGLLKAECESRTLHYEVQKRPPIVNTSWDSHVVGHRLVPIYPSWKAFLSSQKHEFRSAGGELVYLKHQSAVEIDRMKRNLSRAGTWRILYVDDLGKEPDEVQRIYAVEKASHKEEWRRKRGGEDEDLHAIIQGSIHASASEPSFNCIVCFLELNGQTIAYALTLKYGKVAYSAKTSFAEEYRRLAPGVFVVNESIHALCDQGQVREMDCLTDIPVWKRWPNTLAIRVSVVVSRSRVYMAFNWILFASDYAYRGFLDMLLPYVEILKSTMFRLVVRHRSGIQRSERAST
jgi:hypothetical protein